MEAWRHGGMEAWRHGGMEAILSGKLNATHGKHRTHSFIELPFPLHPHPTNCRV
jgi:hypothetical protein